MDDLRKILEQRLQATIGDARATLLPLAAAGVSDRRAFYLRFLDTTFHYTRRSGEFFGACKAAAQSPGLAGFYDHLEKEEATHYRLARRDLESLGGKVSSTPPPGVARYWTSAFDVLERRGAVGALGIGLLTESILRGLGQTLLGRLFAGLELAADQFSFMRVHLVADEDHAREVLEMVDEYFEEHGPAIVGGLTDVGGAYVGMLDDCIPAMLQVKIPA